MLRILAHDVPQNRAISDGDHRFRTRFGFLAKAGAEATAQYEYGNIVQWRVQDMFSENGQVIEAFEVRGWITLATVGYNL